MATMFMQGAIVKSTHRTKDFPLFLMVMFDKRPSRDQFNAVVLLDQTKELPVGMPSNTWITDAFELTDWQDLKTYL